MKDNETLLNNCELCLAPRMSSQGRAFTNLYIYVDGKRFELVPHCRTVREVAYFYALLTRRLLPSLAQPNKECEQDQKKPKK